MGQILNVRHSRVAAQPFVARYPPYTCVILKVNLTMAPGKSLPAHR
jgi:hypothetical protein